ncbi:uncharacterized protein N7511_010766 [Penicillium nucicola]|uniref:uncharacterized protein n=1 Tax=Penicillium nucicola TaxID=1850975 RepID=UPI00254599BA|nr:uncharacterized protein N7511_010766 [Penicillium nucicola]KAJ5749070.1 hypothetical protein N7511_010766 [Penicillium nucicola]
MSQLALASRLKPEIRLAQAVSLYEADLSTDQKMRLREERSRLRDTPPDITDVMRLTAELDQAATAATGKRRCSGPRMVNVLQSVQQFAALGDIIIGGSQNLIACGVWTLVRTSLLLISNYSSYLERLSTLFMEVGRVAPRYERMALLYPRSMHLQSCMYEYFIVIVNLCHKLLKFTQKSSLGQIKASVVDGDLKTSQTNLELWATRMRDEVQLLMAEEIADEAAKNSKFREFSSAVSKSDSYKRQLKSHLRMLDFCSTYDHTMAWKQNRKAGTTCLFHESAEYRNWKNQSSSGTLVYTASLGFGKSVLLANLVDDLHIHVQDSKVPVIYFFCRYDISESLQARTIIGSIARQLLARIQSRRLNFDSAMADLLNKNRLGDFDTMFALLQRVLVSDFKAYVVIDGIDECESSERRILMEELRRLQNTFSIHLCISLRLEPNSHLEVDTDGLIHATITQIPDNSSEIGAFIQAELESCISSGRLIIGDPHLILEIRDTLSQRSQGMFLWVVLQIETMCMMDSDYAIRQALENLSQNLRETFSRILQRSERPGALNQRAILELITAAHTPLTTEQIREALSVVPGNIVWDPSRLPNDINATLSCCGCLVILDEEERTARLVHPSFRQFVLDEPEYVNLEHAHARMAGIIITYLSYNVFGTQLSTTVIPKVKAGSIPAKIAQAALPSSGNIRSLALKLLRSTNKNELDFRKSLAQVRPRHQTSNQFHLRSYAKLYWCSHLLKFRGLDQRLSQLLVSLLEAKQLSPVSESLRSFPSHTLLYGSVDSNLTLGFWTNRYPFEPPVLHLAVVSGHDLLVEAVINLGDCDINFKDPTGQTAIQLAALTRNLKTFEYLLNMESLDVSSENWLGHAPLHAAILDPSEDLIRIMLMSKKFDVNIRDIINNNTVLHMAVGFTKVDLIELLLESESIDTSILDDDGRAPIHLATALKNFDVMRVLIGSSKVDINQKDGRGRAAIHTAVVHVAHCRWESMTLKVLLASERIDVNAKDLTGYTALHVTTKMACLPIVVQLLDFSGTDANARCKDGTALHIAASMIWEELKRHRLDEVNQEYSRSTEHLRDYIQVFMWLLRFGRVDTTLRDDRGLTAEEFLANKGIKMEHLAIWGSKHPTLGSIDF